MLAWVFLCWSWFVSQHAGPSSHHNNKIVVMAISKIDDDAFTLVDLHGHVASNADPQGIAPNTPDHGFSLVEHRPLPSNFRIASSTSMRNNFQTFSYCWLLMTFRKASSRKLESYSWKILCTKTKPYVQGKLEFSAFQRSEWCFCNKKMSWPCTNRTKESWSFELSNEANYMT